MTSYDWTGLRNWRILLFAGAVTVLPGSCAASAVDHFGSVWLAGTATVLFALVALRRWQCPRCTQAFARTTRVPFVRPFVGACRSCGLPEFTHDEAHAPPPIAFAGPKSSERSTILKDPRARVALVLAVPLLWIATCRLPTGESIRLPSGEHVEVLGIMRVTRWTTGTGRSNFLQLTYYAPPHAVADSDLLNLTLPSVAASGDSVVLLNELRSEGWMRALGVRLSTSRSFAREADSSWIAR